MRGASLHTSYRFTALRFHGLTDFGFTDSRTCWITGFVDVRTHRVTDSWIHGQITRCTDTRLHGVIDLGIQDSQAYGFSDVRITDSWVHRCTDSRKLGLVDSWTVRFMLQLVDVVLLLQLWRCYYGAAALVLLLFGRMSLICLLYTSPSPRDSRA